MEVYIIIALLVVSSPVVDVFLNVVASVLNEMASIVEARKVCRELIAARLKTLLR